MAYLEYFDNRAIEFNSEVMKHPELMELLSRHTDPTVKLAHVAAYCGVALEGAYSEEDCNRLCEILTTKLIAKRETPNILV